MHHHGRIFSHFSKTGIICIWKKLKFMTFKYSQPLGNTFRNLNIDKSAHEKNSPTLCNRFSLSATYHTEVFLLSPSTPYLYIYLLLFCVYAILTESHAHSRLCISVYHNSSERASGGFPLSSQHMHK